MNSDSFQLFVFVLTELEQITNILRVKIGTKMEEKLQ